MTFYSEGRVSRMRRKGLPFCVLCVAVAVHVTLFLRGIEREGRVFFF